MNTNDLLIEIGTEELPPKALKKLAQAFADEIHAGLKKLSLTHSDYKWYATPRRLAVKVNDLVAGQNVQEVMKRGPALTVAFDASGKPTKATEGFARSCNVNVSDLKKHETDKGSWIAYKTTEKGRNTAELLPVVITNALSKLPIPKRMRWSDHDIEFIRPVHWSIVMFGKETIDIPILGTQSGNSTFGHRFHHPQPLKLNSTSDYPNKLKEKGYVIADFEARRKDIEKNVIKMAKTCKGQAVIDDDLLDEVTSLVEWPVVFSGSFDKKFLDLPDEVLVATMQDHLKYFPVVSKNGGELLNHFITVSNIESSDPDEIRKGNERVIRPRLSDAAFFWERDRKVPLDSLTEKLKDVVFQQKLGTLADKTERVKNLASFITDQLKLDHHSVDRAAALSKCDLLTEMVGELPELQGVMGRYYAIASGETPEVAAALEEQYMPRFANDKLPETNSGRVLAIADRMDSLVGIFALGQVPTGNKDPFALRRTALACLRILIECEMKLDLEACLTVAKANYIKQLGSLSVVDDVFVFFVFGFMMERLRRYYMDKSITSDVFEAVLARRPTIPFDFHQRIYAVTHFRELPEAENLAAANKRIVNILRKAGNGNPDMITPTSDSALLVEASEIKLQEKLSAVSGKIEPLITKGNYMEALKILSGLQDSIDQFFDEVMVMVDNEELRLARLQLLARIRYLFQQVADISLLQPE